MPLTPLHYPVAYAFHRLVPFWSLPGFIVGAMVPDLEIPVIVGVFGMNVLPNNRLVLHSLVGAVTVGTVLSLLLVILVFRPLVARLAPHLGPRVAVTCRLSRRLVAACGLGALSHVVLDVATHRYNPLWWPFSSTLVGAPYTAVQGLLSRGIHVGLLVAGLGILLHHRRHLPDAILGTLDDGA
jgi:membrane-bound metal-dependent hydrolase YbcI (DUF457 family)